MRIFCIEEAFSIEFQANCTILPFTTRTLATSHPHTKMPVGILKFSASDFNAEKYRLKFSFIRAYKIAFSFSDFFR
jgi:hypothetical protein